jgi:transposase-like protein
MNPTARPELSSEQRHALAVAIRDADRGMRVRAEAVQRWYNGESQAGVAARANVSPTTIRRWVNDFAESGRVLSGQPRRTEHATLHPPRGTAVTLATRQFQTALASELRAAREVRGWSRAELITACGVGYSAAVLGHWERGSRAMPVVAFAVLLRGLGIDPGEVIRRCYDESLAHVRGLPG